MVGETLHIGKRRFKESLST